MAVHPIRVIFLLKDKPLRSRLKALALAPKAPDEIMFSLRAMPRAASLRRAQKALGDNYLIELASDGSDPLDSPALALRLIRVELTARKARVSFAQACLDALGAMRLAERSASTGEFLGTPLMHPPHATFAQSEMDKLALHEQLQWFKEHMCSILMASSCEIERLALAGSVDAVLAGQSQSPKHASATSLKSGRL